MYHRLDSTDWKHTSMNKKKEIGFDNANDQTVPCNHSLSPKPKVQSRMPKEHQHFIKEITDFGELVMDRQSGDNGDGTNGVCDFYDDVPIQALDPILTLDPIHSIHSDITGIESNSMCTINETEHQRAQRWLRERDDNRCGGVWNAKKSARNCTDHRVFGVSDTATMLPLFPASIDDASTTDREALLPGSGTVLLRRRDNARNDGLFPPNQTGDVVDRKNDYLPSDGDIEDFGSITTCDSIHEDDFQRIVTPSSEDAECSNKYEENIAIVTDRRLKDALDFDEDGESDGIFEREGFICGEYGKRSSPFSVSDKSVLSNEDEDEVNDIVNHILNRIFVDTKHDVRVDELVEMADGPALAGNNKVRRSQD